MVAFNRPAFRSAEPAVWVWRSIIAISLLALAGIGFCYLAGHENARAAAVASGQRIEVNLADINKAAVQPAALPLPAEKQSEPVVPAIAEEKIPTAPADGKAEANLTSPENLPQTEPGSTLENTDTRSPASRIPPQAHPDITSSELPPIVAATANDKSLPTEPQDDLTEKNGTQLLPNASKDGLTPMAYYARPFTKPADATVIAVLVSGLGQLQSVTAQAIALPPEVSLSLSPYARELPTWNANARKSGHETYLDMPLAMIGNGDVGPLAITAEKPVETLKALLALQLVSVGLVAGPDEIFSLDPKAASAVMDELHMRGLALIASNAATGFGRLLSAKPGSGMSADRAIPTDTAPGDYDQEFTWIERQAKARGTAVLVVPPIPAALTAVTEWIKTLPDKKITLAPVSALIPPPRVEAPKAADGHGEKKEERHNPALEKGGEKKEKKEKKEAKPSAHHE